MEILNLTQHNATAEQQAAGVVDHDNPDLVRALLTFTHLPTATELENRAGKLARITRKFEAVMIGGAPFFMAPLESALKAKGLRVLYAFSQRESVEEVQPDGSVKKSAVFKHRGFVES